MDSLVSILNHDPGFRVEEPPSSFKVSGSVATVCSHAVALDSNDDLEFVLPVEGEDFDELDECQPDTHPTLGSGLVATTEQHELDNAVVDEGLPVIDGDKLSAYPPQECVVSTINSYIVKCATGDWGTYEPYLLQKADEFKSKFFVPGFQIPEIKIGLPTSPRASWGQYLHRGDHGMVGEIIINSRLFTNEVDGVVHIDGTEVGFLRFLDDVLLHQLVHGYMHTVLGDPESTYRGHGPRFTKKCNDIGFELGLRSVRHAKSKSAAEADRPRCNTWPHCVRDMAYYQGALVPVLSNGGDTDIPDADELAQLLDSDALGPAEAWLILAKIADSCINEPIGHQTVVHTAVHLLRQMLPKNTDRLKQYPIVLDLPFDPELLSKAG